MDHKDRRICKCSPVVQKICRATKRQPSNVDDIIAALQYEEEVRRRKRNKADLPCPKILPKKRRLPRNKNSIPMNPPMDRRLDFIGHCDPEPYKKQFERKARVIDLDFMSTDGESSRKSGRRRAREPKVPKVRYADGPCEVTMTPGYPVVKHTDSNTSILRIPSPKVSGENICAQRAVIKAAVHKPPLPAKSGHDLFRPHSGIILNVDADYVPDVVAVKGSLKSPKIKKKPKSFHCPKGYVCKSRKCKKKTCQRFAAMRRRQLRRAAHGGGGTEIDSTCWSAKMSAAGLTGRSRSLSARRRPFEPQDDDDCGLEVFTKQPQAQIPPGLKKGSLKTHSLTALRCTKERKPGVHYGILMGTFNMYSDRFGSRSRGKQALTMSAMAYCLAFHYHPRQWTMKLVDNLVDAGDQWYLQLLEKVHDHSAYQGMCEVLPYGKKQALLLNRKKMQVILCEPEIIGYTMSLDPTVYNLCRGLKAFFSGNRAGVMLTRVLKVAIWKDKVCYYVFDPAGRNSQAYSNYSSGTAALINVKDLESVAEILLSRSILGDQKFVLAPVKVLKMVDERCEEDIESDRELTQAQKSSMSYKILNQYTAIVNANLHLGDLCFEDSRFKQALTIAIAAMTYAKISPPNTWFSKTLDKILRLGNKLYLDCSHPRLLTDLSLDNIPNAIIIGPYACEIIIYRDRTKGQLFTTKECVLNIKTGLEDFFNHNYNAGIIDFSNYKIAVWRQKDMFYMFDPYPRTSSGERTLKGGKGCCLMLLNTDTVANVFKKIWDYLPATTQFFIHGFKVLKLKKKLQRNQIVCTLSDDKLPGAPFRRTELKAAKPGGGEPGHRFSTDKIEVITNKSGKMIDEEFMGEIISLVDSIQEDYVPPIKPKYKNLPPEPDEPRVVNLDSPTVSVTQVVPPWPKPRDKTNEPPEPDPDPEPTPPPTPPPLPPPEGGVEEEEAEEEELDEEALKAKKEEDKRRKAEEEEARRKAEELPPPMPPPPPSPTYSADEVPLASMEGGAGGGAAVGGAEGDPDVEYEVPTMAPTQVERYVLLTEDAKKRFKLRQIRRRMFQPLAEDELPEAPDEEVKKPHNFHDLPDTSQIIRGAHAVGEKDAVNLLPFAAIMAIVTSYKYTINTWTPGIVDFVIDSSKRLFDNKKEKFQLAPMHIIPKIAIGRQAFHVNIDVVGEGATWQLENVLSRKFLPKYDRGLITTPNYSCAIFRRAGLYYLFDGSTCNGMGIRDVKDTKGRACFLRYRSLHDLVCRILYNKDGVREDQQFILSRILVRPLGEQPRFQLPEDYDYDTHMGKDKKSRVTPVDEKPLAHAVRAAIEQVQEREEEPGYRNLDGIFRIEGTTSLKQGGGRGDVKPCHFVCLIAMLMATMHPLRTWTRVMVDTCIEKGLEIEEKATNFSVCEKRVIRNIILDGKFINVNIKKIIVINENPQKTLEQYMKAVLSRLRYVIVRFPSCNFVVCQADGYYHLFDPYPYPLENSQEISKVDEEAVHRTDDNDDTVGKKSGKKKSAEKLKEPEKIEKKKEKKKTGIAAEPVAGWTLYRTLDSLIYRIRKEVKSGADMPEFYTFELTSVRAAPRYSALHYKLSPLFRPEQNPNAPLLRHRKPRPLVDEKMYWLNVDYVPWSRVNDLNDLDMRRGTPRTMWKDWHIEFPGDLFSLWGRLHPLSDRFPEEHRGKQYLACCVVALVMADACEFAAWTGSFLDGIVIAGDDYHVKIVQKVGGERNHEVALEDFDGIQQDVYPYNFTAKFNNVIFGFVYNLAADRFNLSKALSLFFEKHTLGVLTSPTKNLAFGKIGASYFMYDCQTFGTPVYAPNQGGTYMLKCESLNRLVYCITLTLNIKCHNQQFHLYNANITLNEKVK